MLQKLKKSARGSGSTIEDFIPVEGEVVVRSIEALHRITKKC